MDKHSEAQRFRRFKTSEIILHWVNAIPFLLLLLSGGLMIYARFYSIAPETLQFLKYFHKTTAAVWTISMGITFFFIGLRLNLSNLREFFRLGYDDAKWMFLAMKAIIDHKVQVPLAGKFNTGQKINSLLVLFYVMTFTVTGAIMWFFGTILLAWYLHAALFFMAITTVGGHLYLSFINPSTRVGLWGIFHGWVPIQYIAHHHPLTLGYKREHAVEDFSPEKRHTDPSEKKLESSMFMSAEVVILLMTIVLGIVGFSIFKKGVTLGKEFNSIIRPNQLSKAHQLKELNKCTACHEYTGELKDEKCMECHKIIRQRKEAKSGYHGNNKGKCIKCHREHPAEALGKIIKFEKEEFDHNLATFRLTGKHAEIKECEKCHKGRPKGAAEGLYVGMKYEQCTDCHKDPHNNGLGSKCETCHTDAGWKGKDLKFDHNKDSKYRLEGKHASAKCIDCHKPKQGSTDMGTAVFKGLKYDLCTVCHKDPHNNDLGSKCENCHVYSSWQGKDVRFDHNRDSKYKLEGKHASVKCVECHKPRPANAALGTAQFRNMKFKLCTDCHKDQHNGQFKAEKCRPCHTMNSWREKDLNFDHNKDSKYQLLERHKELACADCHVTDKKNANAAIKELAKKKTGGKAKKDTKFGTAQLTDIEFKLCTDCHEDPHKEVFGADCSYCHNLTDWKQKKKRRK